MAHIAKSATDKNNKVLFFSHRKEINEQVYKTFENNGVNMDLVTIDGVQSLVRKLDKLDEPTIILIDEAHHSKASSYKRIIDYFPNAYKLLFTGTPVRLDLRASMDILSDSLPLLRIPRTHGSDMAGPGAPTAWSTGTRSS